MAWEKTSTTDRRGFESIIGVSGAWRLMFGENIRSILKPFSTNIDVSGFPHYIAGLLLTSGNIANSSGRMLASSSGYNPFGQHTLGEGIISGSGTMPRDINTFINPKDVRTFGIKTPETFIGPGLDIFGYPTPNQKYVYNVSGAWMSTGVPSTLFLGSGTIGPSGAVASGFALSGLGPGVQYLSQVPYPFWNAGPLDIRWDMHRGIWTFSNGIQLARITSVSASGGLDANGTALSENIRYNARVFDGIANTMEITGILHCGPRPRPNTYKVYPYAIDDFCFLVNIETSGAAGTRRPTFGLWMVEMPGATGCSDTTAVGEGSFLTGGGSSSSFFYYSGAGDGPPENSTGVLRGQDFYNGLSTYPLGFSYGGLGFKTIGSGQILIGTSGGTLGKATVVGGSGISVSVNAIPTGTLTISLSTGVAFITAGVNNNITELQGLTTPLSISQGGTGGSGITWVGITGDQNVAGTKSFVSGIRMPFGSSGLPGLSFYQDIRTGIFANSGVGLSIAVTGIKQVTFASTGSRFHSRMTIYDDTLTSNAGQPVLTLYQNLYASTGGSATGDLLRFMNGSTILGSFGNSGMFSLDIGTLRFGVLGSGVTLTRPVITGNVSIALPTGGNRLITDLDVTGWHGLLKLAGSGNLTTVNITVVNGIIRNVVEI